jgi:hypothetical protein
VITIGKLDAASRQLDAAIELLFESREILAVWTIANAASVIFSDLVQRNAPDSSWDAMGAVANGLTLAEWFNVLRRTPNFLKHASNDSEGAIELEERDVEHLIFIAGLNHGTLIPAGQTISVIQSTFQLWYIARYSHEWENAMDREKLAEFREAALEAVGEIPTTRDEALRYGLELLQQKASR